MTIMIIVLIPSKLACASCISSIQKLHTTPAPLLITLHFASLQIIIPWVCAQSMLVTHIIKLSHTLGLLPFTSNSHAMDTKGILLWYTITINVINLLCSWVCRLLPWEISGNRLQWAWCGKLYNYSLMWWTGSGQYGFTIPYLASI